MTGSYVRLVASFAVMLIVMAAPYALTDQLDITVHEWGTFTSIAGENGEAVSWRPFGGPTDLPCFVNRFRAFKGDVLGTVRMETPVLYFYSSKEATANVVVRFPKNVITEWYPKATTMPMSDGIEWRDVRISPAASPDFPVEPGQSHYYAARATDATPVQVGTQSEKFLFYRGVGTFPLPISARAMTNGSVVVKNRGANPIDGLILFENHRGKLRYQVAGVLRNEITLDPRSGANGLSGLQTDLEDILTAHGLYPREARAMIDTWRDSWFEEGARLFYIVPRSMIDAVLPMKIVPAPANLVRVFVGRMEIVTTSVREDVQQAITKGDTQLLERYGRFLEPIAKRIGVKSALVDSVYQAYFSRAARCLF